MRQLFKIESQRYGGSMKRKNFSKGFKANKGKSEKINVSTPYETCTEQLSPYGGFWP